jgi:hypothetical protein
MTVLVRRRYRAELDEELNLHVFDQIDEPDEGEDLDPCAVRTTYIELVDERNEGYEVETLVLSDDGVKTLHKVLGEVIDARLSDGFDEPAF